MTIQKAKFALDKTIGPALPGEKGGWRLQSLK
jgi:hypothetical protein